MDWHVVKQNSKSKLEKTCKNRGGMISHGSTTTSYWFRDDRNVLEEFGTIWLELFRVWKQWGLNAIYPSLLQELDMTSVETDEDARPTIPHLSPVSVPIAFRSR